MGSKLEFDRKTESAKIYTGCIFSTEIRSVKNLLNGGNFLKLASIRKWLFPIRGILRGFSLSLNGRRVCICKK